MLKKLKMILNFITNHPLCEKRKLSCITRFIYWQLRSLLSKEEYVVNWVNDTKIGLTRGETGLTGNYYCGFMEYEDMLFLLHYLRSDDLFIDVGANIGAYTLLASGVIGTKSFAFEPIKKTVVLLKHQLMLNGLHDLVSVVNKGVGSEKGKVFFTNNINTTNHVVVDENQDNLSEVEITTLDLEFELNHSTVIKIDVEGYESFVIEGGRKFFENPNLQVIIIELNGLGSNFGREDRCIDQRLRKFGFKSVQYDPLKRIVKETNTYDRYENTIYVRDIEQTSERVRLASKVKVRTANDILV